MAFLFFVFIAIIGVLFYGDSSLLIAILKFVGGAALVFGIMAIIAYCPWLLIVVIAVALFVRKLKDMAKQDGIDIDVYFVLCDYHDKRRICLPYTDSENFCYTRSAKMYVDCSIQY